MPRALLLLPLLVAVLAGTAGAARLDLFGPGTACAGFRNASVVLRGDECVALPHGAAGVVPGASARVRCASETLGARRTVEIFAAPGCADRPVYNETGAPSCGGTPRLAGAGDFHFRARCDPEFRVHVAESSGTGCSGSLETSVALDNGACVNLTSRGGRAYSVYVDCLERGGDANWTYNWFVGDGCRGSFLGHDGRGGGCADRYVRVDCNYTGGFDGGGGGSSRRSVWLYIGVGAAVLALLAGLAYACRPRGSGGRLAPAEYDTLE